MRRDAQRLDKMDARLVDFLQLEEGGAFQNEAVHVPTVDEQCLWTYRNIINIEITVVRIANNNQFGFSFNE